jgi:hypothetical protein
MRHSVARETGLPASAAARTAAFFSHRMAQGATVTELAVELRVPLGEIRRALSDHGLDVSEPEPGPTRLSRLPKDTTPRRPST